MGNEFNEFNSWKTLLYNKECEAILKNDFLPPIVSHIYPTNKCNYDCDWCIMRNERKSGGELSYDVFKEIIDSHNNMGIRAIHISGGGETTLYPHIDLIKNFNGLKVLSTNGSFLKTKHIELFDRIRVSLDTSNREDLFRLKKKDNFDNVIANIKECVKVKGNKKIGLGFVLSYNNWNQLFDFCSLAESLNVDFVHIRPAYFPKDSAENQLVKDIIKPAYNLVEAAKYQFKLKIFSVSDKFDGFWTERIYENCLATPLNCVITATGELTICQDVFIKFGNLYENKLEEIWNSEDHKNAIKKIDIDSCPRCVMNKSNEIIENVFINNNIMKEFI